MLSNHDFLGLPPFPAPSTVPYYDLGKWVVSANMTKPVNFYSFYNGQQCLPSSTCWLHPLANRLIVPPLLVEDPRFFPGGTSFRWLGCGLRSLQLSSKSRSHKGRWIWLEICRDWCWLVSRYSLLCSMEWSASSRRFPPSDIAVLAPHVLLFTIYLLFRVLTSIP